MKHRIPPAEIAAIADALQTDLPKQARLQLRRQCWHLARHAGSLSKRLLDLGGAGLLLLTALPILLIAAILIKLGDRGPVLFWQTRIGKWGRPFRFPKLRSMVVDAEARREALRQANQHGRDAVTFKLRDDPRITRVGRFLRKTSIDELPQLWCVLRGEMSLVGPRPALPLEVSRYSLAERQRLEVKPGLTCFWQVSGRAELPFAEQCRLDLDYIEQQSLATDLKLLLRTIPAVLSGRGAY